MLGPEEVTAAPSVSVVIPVRDRRAMLRQTLDALARQTWTDHEIIVVDDGSSDGSADEARADAAAGRPVRIVEAGGVGAVAARCAGVDVARGRYLAFTDSDCVPEPDWLLYGVKALEEGTDIVQGLTRPLGHARPLHRTMWVLHEDGLYPTCNVFYRRQAYEAAGGFDLDAGRRFGFRSGRMLRGLGFGEDVLLGWRVRRAGRSAWAPDAVVEHAVFPVDLADAFRRAWATGGFPALVREVPEFRAFLLDGVFLGRRSRLPLYVSVLAIAARRRVLAGAMLMTWVAARTAHLTRAEPSRRRRLAVLPVDLALDAVYAASLVLGSVRSRTVVL